MRILIFCSADLTVGGGSAIRARLITEGLRQCGASTSVVAAGVPPYFSCLGIQSSILGQDINGMETLTRAAKEFAPDVVYGITEGYAGWVVQVAQELGCAIAFDMHGIGVVEIIELGAGYGSRPKRIRNSLAWLASMQKASMVTVANPTLVPLARLFHRNVVPVIGMTDVSHFTPDGPSVTLGRDPSNIQVLYAGNYLKWQGLDLLIEAIKALLQRGQQFEFTILGSPGRRRQDLITWKSELPDNKVHFVDSVDYEVVPQYCRGADVLVIPRPFMMSTYLAFPQKIVDHMASARTIVASNIAPHRWALQNPSCGILCPPTTLGLVEGIRRTLDLRLRVEYSANARNKAIEQFCHLKQTQRLYSLFLDLLQEA